MLRLPDWMVYSAALAALAVAGVSRRERADAPPPPPPPSLEENLLLAPAEPFNPGELVEARGLPVQAQTGTAFAVGGEGVWLTARHVVEGCRRPALKIAGDRAVAARPRLSRRSDVAVLRTEGGPTPIPVALNQRLEPGLRGFHPGFPQGGAGEATSRLLGPGELRPHGRGQAAQPVWIWAEVGRTDGLKGELSGLSGAPVLDERGQAVGVTLAEGPRRGRIYTTRPADMRAALGRSFSRPDAVGAAISVSNYGLEADALRRDLRIAQVICLDDAAA